VNDALYNDALLELAKAAYGAGRLDGAERHASVDNPLCGDRVTVELTLKNGRVAALRQQVKGCVLCQAAASVLGRRAPDADAADIKTNAAAVRAMLKEGAPTKGAWPEIAAFSPVARHKSRHDCVLLPFQAAEKALAETARAPNVATQG
jgi:nitrogen fixation NifU-like protein